MEEIMKKKLDHSFHFWNYVLCENNQWDNYMADQIEKQ